MVVAAREWTGHLSGVPTIDIGVLPGDMNLGTPGLPGSA